MAVLARAGRVAAANAVKGPVVRRMQSKRDSTSAPFMKSSKNCTRIKHNEEMHIFRTLKNKI